MANRGRKVDSAGESRTLSGELPPRRFPTHSSQLSLHNALLHCLYANTAHVRSAADLQSAHINRLDVSNHCYSTSIYFDRQFAPY
jgi:hypothetical protein